MCLTLLKSYIYQTLNFRDELIDTHLDEDAALWSAIGEMKEYLGCDGMSSDETDQESSVGVIKTVRRVRKAWLSEEISEVWRVADTYHRARTQGQSKRGNKSYKRNPVPAEGHTSYNRVVPGLPQNYYDVIWFQSLIESDKLLLRPLAPQSLPDVSR
jgi:hypothetical protein